MGKVEETVMQTRHLVTPDGITLTHRTFTPSSGAAGRVAYCTHSQAQHSLNLRATLEGLAERGWGVHTTDLRGHGHSSGPRAPLAHMEIGKGWERLVADLRQGLELAFEGVEWEDRLVVAPNIGTPLLLEVMKTWPDLARHVVLITPPPNQPAILKLARSFMRARTLLHRADEPDELTMHQLYTFLGARLSDRARLIDVISSDRAITDALLEDEYAWPTPTTGYFHEMFRGVDQAWNWPAKARLREGTQVLILYGGDDPMTANGRFVAPMRRQLSAMGMGRVNAHRVAEGRSGLFIEEERFGISAIVDDWVGGTLALTDAEEASDGDVADISSGVLAKLGLDRVDKELSAEELVELCYHAIDDESRWVEMLYRVTYAISADDALDERHLETIVLALMPHWDRSYQLNRQIMQSAAIGAVLQNVIDRFDIGMAVVSPDMEVSYANRIFLHDFASLTGRIFEAEDLAGLSQALRDRTGPEFQARCRSRHGEALLMVDGNAVGFHFRPQALRQTALQRGGASGVLILRASAEEDAPPATETMELLQFAYGLTHKEAEAALGLLDGLSPDAIAQRCGVSVNTTRTHLKRIYGKVGVQGQTELATRLLKGPIGLLASG